MSYVIWIYSGTILPDYRQGWTDYRPPPGQCPCFASVLVTVCTGLCGITFCCDGDLSRVGVNLEQGDVVLIGDLTDQAVAQLCVGGLWVIPIQRIHMDKWDTWKSGKLPGCYPPNRNNDKEQTLFKAFSVIIIHFSCISPLQSHVEEFLRRRKK